MKKGKLIVIEGNDGSGKETQSKLLLERLQKEGKNVKLISFPDYKSDSSALVKMYLGGEFGSKPEDVNIYAASTFFGVDRFASYVKNWKDFYLNGGIVICDRYTTANMVHQAGKLETKEEKDEYLSWLTNLEFNLYGLPAPDTVIFLKVEPEVTEELIRNRPNKITACEKKDIHERKDFLIKSYENALYIAEKYHWTTISCVDNGNLRSILDLSDEIHEKVEKLLK